MKHSSRARFVKYAAVSFVVLAFATGCAGRKPQMVEIYRPGDAAQTCQSIEDETTVIQGAMVRLMPGADKTAKNWVLGTAGYFFIVPYFFMDLSHAEQQEINAYRFRYNRLLEMAQSKGCGMKREPLPDFADKKIMKEYYASHKPIFPPAPPKSSA